MFAERRDAFGPFYHGKEANERSTAMPHILIPLFISLAVFGYSVYRASRFGGI